MQYLLAIMTIVILSGCGHQSNSQKHATDISTTNNAEEPNEQKCKEQLYADSSNEHALDCLTKIYIKNKNHAELKNIYEYAVTNAHKSNGHTHYKLGLVYDYLKDYKEALHEYNLATSLQPSHLKAFIAIGRVYMKTGEVKDAKVAFEKALEIDNENAEAKLYLKNLTTAAMPNKQTQKSKQHIPANKAIDNCKVTVFQNNLEIEPIIENNKQRFKLALSEFRLQVMPIECSPSVAFLNKHEIDYITQTPILFGTGAYWLAGTPSEYTEFPLTLPYGSNPRTSIDEEIETSGDTEWRKAEYKELCLSLGYCPTPVKHYAAAWPFIDPETLNNRGSVIFNKFSNKLNYNKSRNINRTIVVYTIWKLVEKSTDHAFKPRYYLLKPHLIELDFSADNTPNGSINSKDPSGISQK